jgi:hypothetical protein
LVRLRATQVREEVISFERELGCEKLRPQLLRLKESIAVDTAREDPQNAPQVAPEVAVQPASRPQETRADVGQRAQPQPPAAQPDEACKRDQERLVRLRASPALDQITRFEQELRCARLRPQIVRLRESMGAN